MALVLPLNYRAKSHKDDARKISWHYSRPNQDGLSFSPGTGKEYDIQRYHQYTLGKIECTLGVCPSTLHNWEPRQLHGGQRLFHKHVGYYHREDNTFSAVLTLRRVMHFYSIQLLMRAKTSAVIDGEISSSCYLCKDREILGKYDYNTYGTIPATVRDIKAGDKWENRVNESASIRYLLKI